MRGASAAGNTQNGLRQSHEAALSVPPLLLTRPAEASARFSKLWRKDFPEASVVIAPVTEILPVPHVTRDDTPIFTSSWAPNFIRCKGQNITAWCVGARTAEVAKAQGFSPKIADGTAESLVTEIIASGEKGAFIHYRGRETRGEVTRRLSEAGLSCSETIVYEQKATPISEEGRALLMSPGPVLIPIFSPRSAQRLAKAIEGAQLRAHLYIAAMSSAVAQAWEGPEPECVFVADRPEVGMMIKALHSLNHHLEA